MEYRVQTTPTLKNFQILGRLTFHDHEKFHRMARFLEEPGIDRVVFDLSGLEFVDSAALDMLLFVRETAERMTFQLILKGALGQVKRMLDLRRFDGLFTIQD